MNQATRVGKWRGWSFLKKVHWSRLKKFNIELESEESEPKGSDDLIELYFR